MQWACTEMQFCVPISQQHMYGLGVGVCIADMDSVMLARTRTFPHLTLKFTGTSSLSTGAESKEHRASSVVKYGRSSGKYRHRAIGMSGFRRSAFNVQQQPLCF